MAETESKTVTVAGEKVEVTESPGTKNWKILAWGAAMVVIPSLVDYFGQIDWTEYFSPTIALVVGGVVTMVLRFFSSGPAMSNVTMKVLSKD